MEFRTFWHDIKNYKSPEKQMKFTRVRKMEISRIANLIRYMKVYLKMLVWLCNLEAENMEHKEHRSCI